MWAEWMLDVSFEWPCFVPYERDTGQIVTGMNMLSARCPGKLIGVMHSDGQDAAEKWCVENPDWLTRFGKETKIATDKSLDDKAFPHFLRYECPYCHRKATHKGRPFDDESLTNHIRQCRRNPDWLTRFGKEG